MTHFENAYNIPVCHIRGFACKTNLASNTAFRGFGKTQSMYLTENMAHHIATYLRKDPFQISEINLYKEGDKTHYNQKLIHCTLNTCWQECISMSNYYEKKKTVQKFNRYLLEKCDLI